MVLADARRVAVQELEAEQCRLRKLAQQLPGTDTPDPRAKIERYLIAEYNFGPDELGRLTIDKMTLYIEARQGKAKTTQEDTARRGGKDGVGGRDNANHIRSQPVQRNEKAEARDRWLYDRARQKNPPTWKALMGELNRTAAEHGWRKLGSPQAVKQAVDRYIHRKGLASLPPRKEG
jgi:hypothetical protein